MSEQNPLKDHQKIQDSLDNLSNLKLRQSSLQKHKLQLIQTKNRFVSLLQKLQSSQTRQVSLTQIKKLIQFNNQPDHLKTLKPNHNSTTKEHQVLVVSILTQQFRQNLIDPTDKQPNLLKTCFRIVQILLTFFNDNSTTVQQACARVLLDLNQFCLQDGKYDRQQKLSILFTPLISILRNGVDKASQATATVCINQLVKFWYSHNAAQYLNMIAKEVFSIILKLNSEYHQIFNATLLLIQHKGLDFFQNRLPNFIMKILPIINGTRDAANNLNSYMCRVNVCKIIQKIAILLSNQQRQRLTDLNVIGSLQKATRNKIIQVQMAATRALKAWKGQPMPEQRVQRHSTSKGKPFKSLQQLRDQKKRQRSKSKQNTIKIQNQLNYMKQDLQKMVKGGWGANNRAKNYVKRGTGVGGGHYGQIPYSTPPKNNKSHRQHLQELRDIIKKGSKQNKTLDKFDVSQEIKKYSSPQVPTTSNNIVNMFANKNQMSRVPQEKANPIISSSSKKQIFNSQKRNNINQSNDFQVEQEQGDQAVFIKPKTQQKPQNKYSNQRSTPIEQIKRPKTNQNKPAQQNVVMTPQQAQQLMEHQQSLNNYEANLNLKFNSSNQRPMTIKPQTTANKPSQLKDQKFIQRASKIKQSLNQFAPQISADQLQQLMMQNNLSDVSQNMSNFLNQSDYHFQESQKQQLNEPQRDYEDSMKEDKNKFMKKGAESLKPDRRFEDSLNYTDSRVTKLKDSIASKNIRNSQQSPPKMSQPLRQQFTLNPNNSRQGAQRFQSIQKGHQNQSDQQIEQDLVQSGYEQSFPHDRNMLPLKTKIASQNVKSPLIEKKQSKVLSNTKPKPKQENQQQQTSKNYQQLIQNPPKYQRPHLDRKSFIQQPSKISQIQEQDNQTIREQQTEQTDSVTDKWIQILTLVQNGDLNQAFQQAIALDDPIYMIRLLIITKTPISQLTAQNCTLLWDKFLDIYKHNFISILFVQLFTQANDLNLIKNSLTIQEMHTLLLKIYEVSGTSKGKLSFNAALLYNSIDEGLNSSKKQ